MARPDGYQPIDVDALLAGLGPEFDEQHEDADRWGGANLANCGECPPCRAAVESLEG